MDCARVTEELSALAQGELDPAAGRRVRANLQDCAACRDEKTAIATVLDIPLGTVKSRLHLAVRKLRHALRGLPRLSRKQEPS